DGSGLLRDRRAVQRGIAVAYAGRRLRRNGSTEAQQEHGYGRVEQTLHEHSPGWLHGSQAAHSYANCAQPKSKSHTGPQPERRAPKAGHERLASMDERRRRTSPRLSRDAIVATTVEAATASSGFRQGQVQFLD